MDIEVRSNPDVKLVYTNIYTVRDLVNEIATELYRLNKNVDMLREVVKRRHASVPELVEFVFRIECSRAVSHEIVRHRIATYWQESQRYSDQRPVFILPRSMIKSHIVDFLKKIYKFYCHLKDVEGFRRELARYVLPNACATVIYCRWNLRELCESVIPLRICSRAQPEFRYIAYKLLTIVSELIPEVVKYRYTGPRCIIYNRCPESGLDLRHCESCFYGGLVEALEEHGTDEECANADKIASDLIKKLFR